jgi:hypothetical protein
MSRGQSEDTGRLWVGQGCGPGRVASAGPCCILRVVQTADAIDVVGEAYLSEDLPSLVWTIESFPVGRGGRDAHRVAAQANSAAHRHAQRMPRIRVAAIAELHLDDDRRDDA